jgi:protein-disulfide isomerase
MSFRQTVIVIFCILFTGNLPALAQTGAEVLATANGQSFNVYDLPPNARAIYENRNALAAQTRRDELATAISEILLDEEAKFRKISVDKLLDMEVSTRVPNPTEAQIKAVYEANRGQLGTAATLAEMRPQIVRFLRDDPEQKLLDTFLTTLKNKYKIVPGVDVNSLSLRSSDVVATVGTRKILADWFNEKAKPEVYSNDLQGYRMIVSGLQDAIYANLVLMEARNSHLEPEEVIAREITDKMQEQSDAERSRLEALLRDRLWKKYDVKILLPEPEAPVQKISVDDDPSLGNPKAPVTIVMFSDFQCSACSAAHPIVKEVMQQYGDKVRLVVRDFPLGTIHVNALKAAEAAGAANAQGKFFEYIDILYKNQNALDTASLKNYATQLGLDRARFDTDLDKDAYAAEIAKDVEDGEFYGIRGTPTLFINGVRVSVNTAEAMKKLIDKALTQKSSPNP